MPDSKVMTSSKPLNYKLHLYYLKGKDVMAYNKNTKAKTVILKNALKERKPKYRYFIKPIAGGKSGFAVWSGPLKPGGKPRKKKKKTATKK